MSHSVRQVWLWGSLIIVALLAVVTLGTASYVFAHTPLSEGDTISTVVTPGREIPLTSPDGRVTIVFPANFFTETIVVTYTERAIAGLPANLTQIGPSFTLEAARLNDGQPVAVYAMNGCPVVSGEPTSKDQCDTPPGGFEITFRYLDSEIVSSGVSEAAFALAYYYSPDGVIGKWLPIPTLTDETDNKAIASTWYLAYFALLGVATHPPLLAEGQVEIIVDDLDDAFSLYNINTPEDDNFWWDYWSEEDTYAGHNYYTKDSDATHGRQNWGIWIPTLPEDATYELFAFIPWGHATTTSAHYLIERDGAQIGQATINQLEVSVDWVSLGSYSLPVGTRSKVILDDMTDDPGYGRRDIGFDALKFVCLDCDATPTATPDPTPMAFRITNIAAVDAYGVDLPWDKLVMSDETLLVEARGVGDNPPVQVWAQVDVLPSNVIKGFQLQFQETWKGMHIYRGAYPANQLVNKLDVMTVAAVVWEREPNEVDYEIAEELMNNLGIPAYRRRGIAWDNGDYTRNRPPASLDYLRGAGYEVAHLSASQYPDATQRKFFVQNQADVLFYIGHGHHEENYIELSGKPEVQGSPSRIGDSWNKGLKTVIFYACSVLDINNYDGCADDRNSPGKDWIALPGPQTWLGFKWTAPTSEQGRSQLQKFATEYISSSDWVTAWQTATGENTDSFRHAVAIDGSKYYYWDCPISINDPRNESCRCSDNPTWETVSRTDLDLSNAGLELLVASPVEVHVYDQQEQHVGPNTQGGIDVEIPGSAYWTPIVAGDPHPDARRVSIPTGDLSYNYRITLVGTDAGTFDFYLEIPDRSSSALYHTDYLSVPVAVADAFTLTLARGAGFMLAADRDGDGVFEEQIAPTSVSTQKMDTPVNLTLTGIAGENGWHKSNITATLYGSPRPGLPLLAGMEYDRGNGWQAYTTPIYFTQEGSYTLRYRGAFVSGVQDVIQQVNLQLDKTPPILNLSSPTAITYTLCPYTSALHTGTFTVTYQANDAVAGLQAVSATLDSAYLQPIVAVANGQVFEALFLFPGPHQLSVVTQDRAGWQTVHRQPVFVEVQIEDLDSAIIHLWSMGLISGSNASAVVADLQTALSAAQTARNNGDIVAAIEYLHIFALDVVKQSPAPISVTAARILVRGAQYVTNQMGREIIVTPAYGGQLASLDFDIIIAFPVNTIQAPLIAAYQAVTVTPPITLPRFGPVFDLTALDYENGDAIAYIQHPVTLSVQYGDGTVSGLGERWLALHAWDEVNRTWVMLPTVVDVARDRAAAQVNHFSTYALLEREHSIVFLPLILREQGGAQ